MGKQVSTPVRDELSVDLGALETDINALRDELRTDHGADDLRHLRKMMIWGRVCSVLGYLFSWLPNPLSILLLSTGSFVRWAMVAHHVLHRGYDKVPGIPARLTSKGFAQGWRRYVDWIDWLGPEAWAHEHNTLHHYKLGETLDPDQPEEVLMGLRNQRIPKPIRYALLMLAATTWKFSYYAPNTVVALRRAQERRNGRALTEQSLMQARVWLPHAQPGKQLWFNSYFPYAIARFGLLPLPFLLVGIQAYAAALFNLLAAELLTNLHAFLMIVPNHGGEDLYRFRDSINNRGEFYLRQIIGSANYNTGSDRNDFLHGWLNYQIEHHVFPDMTMLQYKKAQPRLRAICEKHGVPYVQESVWLRLRKLVRVAVGKDTMPYYDRTPGLSPAE